MRIALVGNPNSGKTTLFNRLTGSNQKVGNWPGVTVEKKEGKLKFDKEIEIIDLPGIYSLSPYTAEEEIARTYLIDKRPDAIINIVDGTNLKRNLFLTAQLTDLNIPIILAINMSDILNSNDDKIDLKQLELKFQMPIVEISALTGKHLEILTQLTIKTVKSRVQKSEKQHPFYFLQDIEKNLEQISNIALQNTNIDLKRWYEVKLFERDVRMQDRLKLENSLLDKIENIIKNVEKEKANDAETILTTERYLAIDKSLEKSYHEKDRGYYSISDRIDHIVTNRYLALPIFALVMFFVYYISVSTIGSKGTDWIDNNLFGEGWHLLGTKIWVPGIPELIEHGLAVLNVSSWIHDLLFNGIIAGVGAVLSFVPQMFILFLCLTFLEEIGYMSRIAFTMDRIFRLFGLSGKSFIPLMIGSGCTVPGIMSTRTIKNDSERRMTIITTSFIPCSAKLPIIALIGSAFFNNSGWITTICYFIGIFAVIFSGAILKKTHPFMNNNTPFIIELPAYHWPRLRDILKCAFERSWSFIKKAGSVILLSTIIIWFLMNFGFENGFGKVNLIDNSILAKLGNIISIIFIPLGFGNWQATIAATNGLIAKENIIGTLGVLYKGQEMVGNSQPLWQVMQTHFTEISAFSFLLFNLLCAPCFASIATIKKEMANPKWTIFAISYQTILAYSASFIFYQIALFNQTQSNILGFSFAIILLLIYLFLLFRPNPKHQLKGDKEIYA